MIPRLSRVPSCIFHLVSCQLFLTSFIFISCNKTFQPEIDYSPKLNVYSIMFANSNAVFVRVTAVVNSPSDVSQPVHGAIVSLTGTGISDTTGSNIMLTDTTAIIDGDTVSYYYASVHIVPGGFYFLNVSKGGYPAASAYAYVPYGYATIPDQGTYSVLRDPRNAASDIKLNINLSYLASAEFVQMLVEYRGLDFSGKLHSGTFNALPIDSTKPFTEIQTATFTLMVDTGRYKNAYNLATKGAATMEASHMYVDIIVTQIDDNLYRYFITSTRMADPLQMRTDKIIFSNIFDNAGTGVVAGASVDTTRIFLF